MKTKDVKILAIESSCDETAAAVIGVNDQDEPIVLSNVVSSQIDLHAKTGGIVPEVASRAHIEAITPVVAEALLRSVPGEEEVALDYDQAQNILKNQITHVAYTAGPGLIGSLLVGYSAAKAIAYSLDLPIIPVNHIEGHIYSAYNGDFPLSQIKFPVLSMTVSGGHTSLTLIKNHGQYEIIGETLDDAAGEAFDKVSKLLGLGYPGGPAISKYANEFRQTDDYTKRSIVFPRPIMNDGTFNFSFSGLKTAVLQKVLEIKKDHELTELDKQEVAAAFEDAAADVLVTKTIRAAKKFNIQTIILAGGVAANKYLRSQLELAVKNQLFGAALIIPPFKYCGDNAAMIGLAAFYHIKRDQVSSWKEVKVDSNLEL